MDVAHQLVVFRLDDRRYGLRLSLVERVVPIVHIAELPKAPDIVLGVINIQGRIVPVVDLRRRFRLPPRPLTLSDHLLVARAGTRWVGLIVDAALGVVERPAAEVIGADAIVSGMEYVEGVVKLEDGLIFIHDLSTFLSLDEEKVLETAMSAG